MSPTLTTFFFEAANFLVLAAVLGWVFFSPVRQALADYRAQLDAAAKEASQKLEQAEQLRSQLDGERKSQRDELASLRAQMVDSARQEAEKIVAQARQQAERTRAVADQHAARLDERQTAQLARAAAKAAGDLVGRLLMQLNGEQLNTALFQAACERARSLTLNGSPVTIETAQPLDASQQALLGAALGPAAAGATHRVVPELGGGMRLTTSQGLIDASIAGMADFAQRQLAMEMEHQASPPNEGAASGQ